MNLRDFRELGENMQSDHYFSPNCYEQDMYKNQPANFLELFITIDTSAK